MYQKELPLILDSTNGESVQSCVFPCMWEEGMCYQALEKPPCQQNKLWLHPKQPSPDQLKKWLLLPEEGVTPTTGVYFSKYLVSQSTRGTGPRSCVLGHSPFSPLDWIAQPPSIPGSLSIYGVEQHLLCLLLCADERPKIRPICKWSWNSTKLNISPYSVPWLESPYCYWETESPSGPHSVGFVNGCLFGFFFSPFCVLPWFLY